MRKLPFILPTFFLLFSLTIGEGQVITRTFKSQVETFVERNKPNYIKTSQTRSSSGNDYILDYRAKTIWRKTVTLKRQISFRNKYKQTLYPRLFLSFYQFIDTVDCERAKLELLKCLGDDCTDVKWGDNGSSVKSSPFIYVFNPKQIVVCHIYCEHVDKAWDLFKKELLLCFELKQSKVMELLGCGAPLKFHN